MGWHSPSWLQLAPIRWPLSPKPRRAVIHGAAAVLPTGWLPAHKLTRPTIDTGCDRPTTFQDPTGGMRAIAGTPGRRGRRDEPAGSSRTCVGRATVSHIKGAGQQPVMITGCIVTTSLESRRCHGVDQVLGGPGVMRSHAARGVPGPEDQARKSPDHRQGTGVGGEVSDEPRGCPGIIMPSAWPVAMG
jgi:hypothetical protein